MNWNELLRNEIATTYNITEGLMDLVDPNKLDWKPRESNNWMTTGQLLMHLTNACGQSIKGFVTGDWEMPEGMEINDLSPEEMLPPAEKMPSVDSLEKAKELLKEDKELSLQMLDQLNEDELANNTAPAPWDPSEVVLGYRLLQMIEHLSKHSSQLYYYLKLQGKAVNTGHLYGM
jgi:uncharacterized damage-inducible protein DinB